MESDNTGFAAIVIKTGSEARVRMDNNKLLTLVTCSISLIAVFGCGFYRKQNVNQVQNETPIPMAKALATPTSDLTAQQVEEWLKITRKPDSKGFIISAYVSDERPDTLIITVSNQWHIQHKQERLQGAQLFWKAWAMIHSPGEPDKSRISIVDELGNEVGGSRMWGGSLIWVQED